MAAMLAFSACAALQPAPADDPDPDAAFPEMVAPPDDPGRTADSRMAASYSLTLQGYQLLQKNDYDGAIRILERAVGVNPGDGQGYYYLAEAWLEKKNYSLAAQFNGLATLYLRSDATWSRRAENQKERIDREIDRQRQG